MITRLILAAIAAIAATQVQAQTARIVMEEFMVPAVDPGIQIYVRNKRPADMAAFRPERTVLYVHGATYPASTSFDLALDGLSWMDYLAARGYDVYLLDVRGYGRSTRPPEMDKPASDNAPIVRTDTAVKDVGSAVDFILKRRGVAADDRSMGARRLRHLGRPCRPAVAADVEKVDVVAARREVIHPRHPVEGQIE